MAGIVLIVGGFVFLLNRVAGFPFDPEIFPGECPDVSPLLGFPDPTKYLGEWYTTHTTQKELSTYYHCMKRNISQSLSGIQIKSSMFNSSEHRFKMNFEMKAIPGLPGRFFSKWTNPQTPNPFGDLITNQDVSMVTMDGVVMNWSCENLPEESHIEDAIILSVSPTTFNGTVDKFLNYLHDHGSYIEEFFPVENNC